MRLDDPSRWNRRVVAEFKTRHRRWPLGTRVCASTPLGPLEGVISKHWRKYERGDRCSVDFKRPFDFGDGNGARYAHDIPFRCLKKLP